MHETIDTTIEKIYIIQPITRENEKKFNTYFYKNRLTKMNK